MTGMPIRFHRYSVPLLNIYLNGEKNPANSLSKTEASLFPGGIGGKAELRLNGGLLTVGDWPRACSGPVLHDLRKVRSGGERVFVFRIPAFAQSEGPDPGSIEFSGTIRPLAPEASYTLGVELDSFRLSYLLGADIGRFFLGRLETLDTPESNFLLVTPGGSPSAKLELATTNALDSRIDLTGFKFLANLANVIEERWYELPNFDDGVSMLISRQGGQVEVKDFSFREAGPDGCPGKHTKRRSRPDLREVPCRCSGRGDFRRREQAR